MEPNSFRSAGYREIVEPKRGVPHRHVIARAVWPADTAELLAAAPSLLAALCDAIERMTPPPPPEPPISERIILDLCGGSGSWSRPYAEAGYRVQLVTLPELDVRTFVPPPGVWGVLCAPPCTEFTMARNGQHTRQRPRDFIEGMETVNACLRVVHQARPRWWALENPVGHLSQFLGVPRDVWEPCDFGDPWTKRTAIWGEYSIPKRGPYVQPRGGGPFCKVCDPRGAKTTWCANAAHRAVTPPGFARAFFEANP